jgi:hypothetical protein
VESAQTWGGSVKYSKKRAIILLDELTRTVTGIEAAGNDCDKEQIIVKTGMGSYLKESHEMRGAKG